MPKEILFKGKPLTIVGRDLKLGQTGFDFRVIANNMDEVGLSNFAGKIKVVSSFPSLDTPVCDLQVKEFNKRAIQLSDDIVILGISKDLPFAQKRFCEAHGIDNLVILSDYKTSSFGINYGLLIKELNLLARAVVILDKNNIVRYIQIVKELTNSIDYEDTFKNLKEVLKSPSKIIDQDSSSKCKPCEGGMPSFSKEKIAALMAQYQGWEVLDDKKLKKEFKFSDFSAAKYFLDLIANIAQEQGHHPMLTLTYNKVKVILTTHAASGLTENDFIMAKIIDQLGG
ncbi:MAG: thiol peroxidase [Candidatus Omnitrophica bacterium]|jgi:thiol peroxidase|nr:thiol peroxidase [Candidatus Omnitrophota bacterium]